MTFQYRPEWSGTTGGPGVSVFNVRLSGAALSTGPQQMADNIRAFYSALFGSLPNELQITFPAEVQELDTVTGMLTNVHPVTPPAAVAGGSTGGYMHAGGVRVDWKTSSILNGRRLRGRTYLVPWRATDFDTSGRLTATATSTIQTAADNLIAAMENIGSLGVWSRTHGVIADVASAGVSPLGAVLRSRRD